MKYAIKYHNAFRHYDDIDEVIFNYTEPGHLDDINKIIKKQEQKVILNITGQTDYNSIITKINDFRETHSNIMVQIDFLAEDRNECIELLIDNNIPFMFINYAKDFSTICAMRVLGAEDIYIVEDMGFNLDVLQNMREGGTRFRVIPNIAQSPKGTGAALPQIIKFWIRPEDTEIYEQYIDVMEFTGPGDRLSALYEIYTQRQWLGSIQDLILDYKGELENTTIAPHFGKMRAICHKQCMYNHCNICTEIEKLGFNFKEAELALIKKRFRDNKTQEKKEKVIEELKERGKEINELTSD